MPGQNKKLPRVVEVEYVAGRERVVARVARRRSLPLHGRWTERQIEHLLEVAWLDGYTTGATHVKEGKLIL
jgi:hypothetical protein